MWGQVNLMMLALKSGPQIAAKVGNPAGLLCRRIWYSVVKTGVLGITEYRQGRPLQVLNLVAKVCYHQKNEFLGLTLGLLLLLQKFKGQMGSFSLYHRYPTKLDTEDKTVNTTYRQ